MKALAMSNSLKSRRVVGIDPGFDRLGIAVLEGDPSCPTWVWSECVRPAKGAKEARLSEVLAALERVLTKYNPDALAIETLFFSTNRTSALGVAEARGVVLAVAGKYGLRVQEYSPQAVKLAVTGYGASDKKAIATMIPHLLTLPALTKNSPARLDDELDAIAVAIAGLADRGGMR